MKRSPLASVFCAVLVASVTGGCSLVLPPPPPTIFQRMDANHDGKISRAEFSAGFAEAMLTVHNRGEGGTISQAEWNDFERTKGSKSFQQLDLTHDGKLTRAELASGKQRDVVVNAMFDRIDKNHDGFISLDEGRPSGLDRTPQERAEGTGL